jgi:phosphonate transport system ATP-binding protein
MTTAALVTQRGFSVALETITAHHPTALAQAPACLKSISLSISAGEQVAIIGPSGAGKTSFLAVMAASLKPTQGQVLLDSRSLWALPQQTLQALRGQIYYAPQTPPLPPRQRVVTSVLAGRLSGQSLWQSLVSLVYPKDAHLAAQALAAFDLDEKLWLRVDRLSGGERQRVGLARALLSPARLWLIDEPLSALDPKRAHQVISVLTEQARARGITLVCSLHQVDFALSAFPRVIGLQDGRVAFDLPAKEVDPARLAELYAQEAIPDSSDLRDAEDEDTRPEVVSTRAMVRCR